MPATLSIRSFIYPFIHESPPPPPPNCRCFCQRRCLPDCPCCNALAAHRPFHLTPTTLPLNPNYTGTLPPWATWSRRTSSSGTLTCSASTPSPPTWSSCMHRRAQTEQSRWERGMRSAAATPPLITANRSFTERPSAGPRQLRPHHPAAQLLHQAQGRGKTGSVHPGGRQAGARGAQL